jgi:hypothetical protein
VWCLGPVIFFEIRAKIHWVRRKCCTGKEIKEVKDEEKKKSEESKESEELEESKESKENDEKDKNEKNKIQPETTTDVAGLSLTSDTMVCSLGVPLHNRHDSTFI